MPSKKHKPEEIIGKLREAEIVLAHGGTLAAEASPLGGLRITLTLPLLDNTAP